ncbi:OLC1v1035665C1 [Oldenlandia corymbosa var. corymbosa]|uniref:OLC1v1035665C1 n=1 Tax=Oldenlandia corymbosa var. corymbosa TaxID=529605 RepID=A0AAV1CU84_OLDCO|nr:OLC1v1035665C1 [Oldenlandia corymbosa var. corymbosa]
MARHLGEMEDKGLEDRIKGGWNGEWVGRSLHQSGEGRVVQLEQRREVEGRSGNRGQPVDVVGAGVDLVIPSVSIRAIFRKRKLCVLLEEHQIGRRRIGD